MPSTAIPDTAQQARARLARASKKHSDPDPEVLAARQNLAAAKLQQYIESVVDKAPPLSPEQRSTLVALLSENGEFR